MWEEKKNVIKWLSIIVGWDCRVNGDERLRDPQTCGEKRKRKFLSIVQVGDHRSKREFW